MHKYPSVDEVIKNFNIAYLEYSSHPVFSVNILGEDLVYKKSLTRLFKKNLRSFFKSIENPLFFKLLRKNHFSNYRLDSGYDCEALLNIESQILAKWSKNDIPCTQIIEKHKGALIYKKINSVNYRDLMNHESRKEYTQLIELITKIRDVAKSKNDPEILHSDMLPKNFLYDSEKKIPIAIDPGIILKNYSLRRCDAHINLNYIYSLNIFADKQFYIDQFLDTLDKDEKKMIKAINKDLPLDLRLYVDVRSKIISIVRKNYINPLSNYSKENICYIGECLSRHNA